MIAAFLAADKLSDMANTEILPVVVFGAIALLVLITARMGKPRRKEASTEFPPALGTRIVLWLVMLVWAMLILAPLGLGMNWLALISWSAQYGCCGAGQ